MAEQIAFFPDQFLASFAAALDVPYKAFVDDMGWSIIRDPRILRATLLIQRAAYAMVNGRARGWKRKLKRARRLQRAACRDQTSNAWFSMHWDMAVQREIRMRTAVTNAMLAAYIGEAR